MNFEKENKEKKITVEALEFEIRFWCDGRSVGGEINDEKWFKFCCDCDGRLNGNGVCAE